MKLYTSLTWLLATISSITGIVCSEPEIVTDELLSAAKAQGSHQFWMETIKHTGISPFLNDSSYVVYRNVKDFGAKGDGISDDTAAIQSAIDDGGRCYDGCGPGTIAPAKSLKPALIYFPSGTYRITSTLKMYMFTQLVGNPLGMPIIKADSSFTGLYLLDGFPAPVNSTIVTTIVFYMQLRNFVFDTTAVDPQSTVACVNWATAQAVTLSNNHLIMAPGSMHQGIAMNGTNGGGGGSATYMGILKISGGNIGITLNNQQYALRDVEFTNVRTGIFINHIFTASLQGMVFNNCSFGINSTVSNPTSSVGSVVLIDSSASSVGTLFVAEHNKTADGSIVLENISIDDVGTAIVSHSGETVLAGSKQRTKIASFIQGNLYTTETTGAYAETSEVVKRSKALLDRTGKYFTRARPQYEQIPSRLFSSVRDYGAIGDGHTDATEALNKALAANAYRRVTYLPAGTYIVTDTIHVPVGSRIVGEVWSTIMASGENYSDELNPRVMFKMGAPGTHGLIEVSDILFDVAEVLPGAILVENNVSGPDQGSVGLWDSHFKVGGTENSRVEVQCPSYPPTGTYNVTSCKAAFMFLHLRPESSTYIESSWGWTVNRDLDALTGSTNGTSQAIAVGRGMLVESKKGTWLVGTAFEHSTLYQYQFVKAENVFALMAQTETVYWQPSPPAPAPFTVNPLYHDPDFSNCDGTSLQCYMGWSLRIIGGSGFAFYGLGFWQFFNGLGGCSGAYCQDNILSIEGSPKHLAIYNLGTHTVRNMVTVDGEAKATSAQNVGGWGGLIAAYLPFALQRL